MKLRLIRRLATFVGAALVTAVGLSWWLHDGDLAAAARDGVAVVARPAP